MSETKIYELGERVEFYPNDRFEIRRGEVIAKDAVNGRIYYCIRDDTGASWDDISIEQMSPVINEWPDHKPGDMIKSKYYGWLTLRQERTREDSEHDRPPAWRGKPLDFASAYEKELRALIKTATDQHRQWNDGAVSIPALELIVNHCICELGEKYQTPNLFVKSIAKSAKGILIQIGKGIDHLVEVTL